MLGLCRQIQAAISLIFDRVSDVSAVPVDWIWTGRIARRKITLFAGDPGVGKTQLTCDLAARISVNELWPDKGRAPSGSTIILTAEDSVSDTLRPRLEAAGADLTRVHVLRAALGPNKRVRTFSLQTDLALLADKVHSLGDVSIVIIDPITSYMGAKIDSHRTTDVRAVLEPVADFADKSDIGVLAVTHPPKATQTKALHAITGSLAFVAAARLVFIAVEEQETDRRLLLPVKNNLGPLAQGLGFRLSPVRTESGIDTSMVSWDTTPVAITANQALYAASEGVKASTALNDAKEFLQSELSCGPVACKEIAKAAEDNGVSKRTLARACKQLRVVKAKDGYQEGWTWSLPP